jgi:hypothetical protein
MDLDELRRSERTTFSGPHKHSSVAVEDLDAGDLTGKFGSPSTSILRMLRKGIISG